MENDKIIKILFLKAKYSQSLKGKKLTKKTY